MKPKNLLTVAILSLSIAVGCSKSPSAKPSEAAPPALTPQQMQEAFVKAATPGPEQKLLSSLVGDWKAKVTMWMDPTKPPEVSEGKSTNVLKYGGRFLEMNYVGTWMGQKFEGTGLWGYDNIGKQYQSVWYDSMGTQVMSANGSYDAVGKKLVSSSTMSCPIANGPVNVKQVLTIVDDNKHIYESFMPAPDGKEMRTMEIVYTKGGSCKSCGKGKSKKKSKK